MVAIIQLKRNRLSRRESLRPAASTGELGGLNKKFVFLPRNEISRRNVLVAVTDEKVINNRTKPYFGNCCRTKLFCSDDKQK